MEGAGLKRRPNCTRSLRVPYHCRHKMLRTGLGVSQSCLKPQSLDTQKRGQLVPWAHGGLRNGEQTMEHSVVGQPSFKPLGHQPRYLSLSASSLFPRPSQWDSSPLPTWPSPTSLGSHLACSYQWSIPSSDRLSSSLGKAL